MSALFSFNGVYFLSRVVIDSFYYLICIYFFIFYVDIPNCQYESESGPTGEKHKTCNLHLYIDRT